MKTKITFLKFLTLIFILFLSSAFSRLIHAKKGSYEIKQDKTTVDLKVEHPDKKIYGWQIMTMQEQMEHRQIMSQLKTPEERNAYRLEHHKKMQERAKSMGMTLSAEPPEKPAKQKVKNKKGNPTIGQE